MTETEKRLRSESETRKRKREWIIIAVASVLIVFFTAVEIHLSRLSADVTRGNNILIFAVINIIVLLIVLLVFLVSRNVVKLFLERRSNAPGAKLRTRLVLAFLGLSLVPTMLLFFVSAGFIHNTVQNWFNKQVEDALAESLDVAQTYYKSSGENALYYARQISDIIKEQKLLNEQNLPLLKELIRQKQKEYNLGVVEVFSAQNEELVRASNPKVPQAEFTNPSSGDITTALAGKAATKVNPMGKADLIRGIVPVHSNWNDTDVVGVVVVNYYVPHSLVAKMNEISASYQQFRQLKLLKNPISTGYILTLFLMTMAIVLLSVWFGVYLANSLTIPLQELSNATRKIADGDLEVQLDARGGDEIGTLVTAFNTMARDLRTNQAALRRTNDELIQSNLELESRRRYMEIVLENVTAGVISISSSGILTTVNKSAEKLLNIRSERVLGKNFREVLSPEHLDMVKGLLRDMIVSKQESIRKQVVVPAGESRMTLMVNLAMLKDEEGDFRGTVAVFDDLTQLVKAQRMAAWREVARRIAHEIKNPLTPIQLSAQRLRKRYLSRFGDDEKVFDECTEMIVKSVDELKTLVDEFSNFARMPAAQPAPNDMNEIIREALTLFQEAHRDIAFTFKPDAAAPALQLDRDQIKRVMINLLDNAVAAIDGQGEVAIATSFNHELKMVTCVIADTGCGIPAEDKPRLFEPYFSTKKGGTGLGLAIVNSIIADHHGFIRVRDNAPKGSRFIIELPASTWA